MMELSISPVKSLRGHTDTIQDVVFFNNQTELSVISTSNDTTIRIWNVESENQEAENLLEGHDSETAGLAVSLDGKRIVSGDADGQIIMWDAETKNMIRSLSHHTDWVVCIKFSPDEKGFASVSYDGTLKIWNAETGELAFDIDDHQDRVWTLAYSPDGRKIATGSYDSTVRIWNTETGKQQIQPLLHEDGVHSVVWSKDSRLLISACKDGNIYFWSAPTGAQLGSPLRAHSDTICLLAISPDGELIASASKDCTARLWNITTRKPFGHVLHHSRAVSTVAFSPNGQMVATGGRDNTIFLWDISQETFITTNAVSPQSAPIASVPNVTSDLNQAPGSFDSSSASSTPALDELPDLHPEMLGSRHAVVLPSPSSSLPQGNSYPETSATLSSTPISTRWKRFPLGNNSTASETAEAVKRWAIPRIGAIMHRKHGGVEPLTEPNDP